MQSCTQETNTLEQIFKRLDNNSTGEQNIFALGENTDTKKIQEVMGEIRKTVSESPDQNFLIVYILTGKGMQYNGKHMMLLNDFDQDCGFYSCWQIQRDVEEISKTYPNSYQVAICASTR